MIVRCPKWTNCAALAVTDNLPAAEQSFEDAPSNHYPAQAVYVWGFLTSSVLSFHHSLFIQFSESLCVSLDYNIHNPSLIANY
jgi:hypothetical protein